MNVLPGRIVMLCLTTAMLTAADGAGPGFLQAFRSGDYMAATSAARALLQDNELDAAAWRYLGAALAASSGQTDLSVDAFERARLLNPDLLPDRGLLALEAQALVACKAFASASERMRSVAELFPHSRLASQRHPLMVQIEARLQRMIERKHLNWYEQSAVQAYREGLAGLAIRYMQEWLVLAEQVSAVTDDERQDRRLLAAAWMLEEGAPLSALALISDLSTSVADYRCALIRGQALIASGEPVQGLKVVGEAQQSSNEEIRQRAAWLELQHGP